MSLYKMKRDLQEAYLSRWTWDELFREKVPGLGSPNAKGECAALCPFQDHQETKPSWSVNVQTGIWHCKGCRERAGDYVHMLCWLDGKPDPGTYELTPLNYNEVQEDQRRQLGLIHELDQAWLRQTQARLKAHPEDLERAFKPGWDHSVAVRMELGYDVDLDRIILPVHNLKGKVVNAKYYGGDHGPKAKMTWATDSGGDLNFPFPKTAMTEAVDRFVLTEGEPDVITLRSFAFAGVSGTMGASHPVPPGEWWRNRRVAILMDVDEPGRAAAKLAARVVLELATEVVVCELPNWNGRPSNADVSDYVRYLLGMGATFEGVQAKIHEVLDVGVRQDQDPNPLDQDPVEVPFARLLSAETIGVPVTAPAKVVGRGIAKFALPTSVRLQCDHGSLTACRSCPMHIDKMGDCVVDLDSREARSLSLIQVRDADQLGVMKALVGAPPDCPKLRMEMLTSVNVIPTVLMPPTPEIDGAPAESADEFEARRKEAFLILPDAVGIEANRDYQFQGVNYADPRDQKMVFLGHEIAELDESWGTMRLTPEVIDSLLQFHPDGPDRDDVMAKLVDVAEDLARSVTGIVGRADLHLFYRSIWHSVLSFPFRGKVVPRGWLEGLVIGDTSCGKSASFQAMAKFYRLGVLVDCQNQTIPGLVGTTVQSTLTGEWMAVPGLLPQLDGRLVCFDEFHSKAENGTPLIAALASQRSEGVVRIQKAAHATFAARVRAIYLANPGQGALLRDLGKHAVALIPRIIPQPEHVRRFDIAMSVATEDVPSAQINEPLPAIEPRYPREAQLALLRWIYSRRTDQVEWAPAAEDAVSFIANWMIGEYHDEVPLVERGSQWLRVAKLAVAVAAQCFSTSEEHEHVLVRPCHVWAARALFQRWFNSRSFGYDAWSEQQRAENELRDPEAMAEVFRQVTDGRGLAAALLAEESFTERHFRHMVAGERAYAEEWLSRLKLNRAIRQARRGERYERTPAFTRWLQAFLSSPEEGGLHPRGPTL